MGYLNFVKMWVLVLVLVLTYVSGGDCIRLLDISVPHQVGSGQDVQLRCIFILEGHKLYSVKWFKGEKEFYRVVPNETPRTRVFPVSALAVDMLNSNESMVSIRDVKRANTGTYRCEVSAEAPDFETDYREANMSVIDLPFHGPIIVNVQKSYLPGEAVALNCTSAPSNPMANLKWYIDGQLAAERYIRRYTDANVGVGSEASSRSSSSRRGSKRKDAGDVDNAAATAYVATVELKFSVDQPSIHHKNFAGDVKNLTCVALVGDIYKSSTLAALLVLSERHPMMVSGTTTIQPPSHLHASSVGDWMHSDDPDKWIWLLSSSALLHWIRLRIDSSPG